MNNNINPEEIAKFDDLADNWWDTKGPVKPLHQLNPVRLNYILKHTTLQNKKILDVGCGGGILTESLAKERAQVRGIDLSEKALQCAKQHAAAESLSIEYELICIEELAEQQPHTYDVITCMELLEHVPNPKSVIKACAQLLKPRGYVFFSTINRSFKAFLTTIIGAEYLLKMLPKGTHDYSTFIKPAELNQWASQAQLHLIDLSGIRYQPLSGKFTLSQDVSANYVCCYQNETD